MSKKLDKCKYVKVQIQVQMQSQGPTRVNKIRSMLESNVQIQGPQLRVAIHVQSIYISSKE